jgi:thioredoxin-like negative regulator of GroEL
MSEATTDRPVHLDDEAALDAFVAEHDRALVEFYTEGCSMCAGMEPVLSNVARASDVAVALVNPRNDPPLVERFEVRSVPLLVHFEDRPVRRLADGFVGAERVLAFVDGA